jgi:hypothetical protein
LKLAILKFPGTKFELAKLVYPKVIGLHELVLKYPSVSKLNAGTLAIAYKPVALPFIFVV